MSLRPKLKTALFIYLFIYSFSSHTDKVETNNDESHYDQVTGTSKEAPQTPSALSRATGGSDSCSMDVSEHNSNHNKLVSLPISVI